MLKDVCPDLKKDVKKLEHANEDLDKFNETLNMRE